MKKISIFLAIILLITTLTGCSIFSKKTIVDDTKIEKISNERMEELVLANNDVVNTIYGNPIFFTTAELQVHVYEYYTKNTVEKYFTDKLFYDDKDGNIKCNIKTDNRKNIATMKYSIEYNSIFITNDTQTFTVVFSDKSTEYSLNFTATFNEETNEWLLTDIVI